MYDLAIDEVGDLDTGTVYVTIEELTEIEDEVYVRFKRHEIFGELYIYNINAPLPDDGLADFWNDNVLVLESTDYNGGLISAVDLQGTFNNDLRETYPEVLEWIVQYQGDGESAYGDLPDA